MDHNTAIEEITKGFRAAMSRQEKEIEELEQYCRTLKEELEQKNREYAQMSERCYRITCQFQQLRTKYKVLKAEVQNYRRIRARMTDQSIFYQ